MLPDQKYAKDFAVAFDIIKRLHPDGAFRFVDDVQCFPNPQDGEEPHVTLTIPRWLREFKIYLVQTYPSAVTREKVLQAFFIMLMRHPESN